MHCREWPDEKTSAEATILVEANSKPHDIVIYTDGSVTRDWFGWGFTVKRVEELYTKTIEPQSHDLQSDQGGRSSHTCSTMAILPARRTEYTHHFHRLSKPPAIGGVWNGLPTGTQPCTAFGCKYFCGSTTLGMPESVGMNWADRLSRTADVTSCLHLGRVEVLRGWKNFLNTDRPEHRSIDRLKVRGVERGSGRHPPPRSGTICVQQDKHWHCFKGNLGETVWRRGGAHIGLSERDDVILSRIKN